MIHLEKLSKQFEGRTIISNLSLSIRPGRHTVILGRSGCGKTTLLNMIAGIIAPDEGLIEKEDDEYGYVFQESRLLAWRTVRQNLMFTAKKGAYEKIDQTVALLKIQHLLDQPASSLSGGEKQRVNIARAFLAPGNTILMDEPFSSLDITLKSAIISDISTLVTQQNKTIILVTHNIDEALLLGRQIIILGLEPAQIIKKITIDQPLQGRHLSSTILTSAEQEILRAFNL